MIVTVLVIELVGAYFAPTWERYTPADDPYMGIDAPWMEIVPEPYQAGPLPGLLYEYPEGFSHILGPCCVCHEGHR